MKKLLALLITSLTALAQTPTQTPNLGLYKPAHGTLNWDSWYNQNWDKLDAKLSSAASVKDYGAVGNGSTDDTAAFQAAITAAAGNRVVVPDGTYKITSTLQLAVASAAGTSLECVSPKAQINYHGSGAAIEIIGNGASNPALTIRNCLVDGTHASTGANGLHFQAFTAGHVENVRVQNFTTGNALLNEGGIAITFINCEFNNSKHGVHNVGFHTPSNGNFSANANKWIGGQVAYNTGWGIWEDAGTAGVTGPNQNNVYDGIVMEVSGTNGLANSGFVYFQMCDSCVLQNSYIENIPGSTIPNMIVIGGTTTDGIQNVDASPNSPVIQNNLFFSQAAQPTIRAVKSRGMIIMGNNEEGTPSAFLNLGSGLNIIGRIYGNQALGASTTITGADSGDTMGDVPGLLNSVAVMPFQRGVGFHLITGSDQDLAIRTRQGGTNTLNFLNNAGSTYGSLTDGGQINLPIVHCSTTPGTCIKSDGDIVLNTAGSHLDTQAANTDIQFSLSLSSATSAAYTFSRAYNNAPRCFANPQANMGSTTYWVTTSATAATIHTSASFTGTFDLFCIGAAN